MNHPQPTRLSRLSGQTGEKASMNRPKGAKLWFLQARGPFLILSVVLVLIGISAAHHEGFHNGLNAALVMAGVVLAHASVNLFNELSDYETGIDAHTFRTPFNGGSGLLQSGMNTPLAVKRAAYGTLFASGLIGLVLTFTVHWFVAVLAVPGGLAIRFYTTHFARWRSGEVVAGLTLGTLVVAGTYFVIARTLKPDILFVSLAPGILTSLLLFLNEFPDMEADRQGGRHHLVIHYGRKVCSRIYAGAMIVMYLIIAAAPLVTAPFTLYIAFLSMPLAFRAVYLVLRNPDDIPGLVPALGLNVGVVILTDLFLAVGYYIG